MGRASAVFAVVMTLGIFSLAAAQGFSNEYIQNQSSSAQDASFRISGDAFLDGGLAVGTSTLASGTLLTVNGAVEVQYAGTPRVLLEPSDAGVVLSSPTATEGVIRESGGLEVAAATGNVRLQTYTGDVVFQAGGGERLRVTYGGRMGVGTAAPSHLLDVRDMMTLFRGELTVDRIVSEGPQNTVFLDAYNQDIYDPRYLVDVRRIRNTVTSYAAPLYLDRRILHVTVGNASGAGRTAVGYTIPTGQTLTHTHALMVTGAVSGGSAAELMGKVTVEGSLQVTGTKNFVQEDPADPGSVIAYVALEGGESGTYWRGRARLDGGRARIRLPEHFRKVTSPTGITVQVTGSARCRGWLAVTEKSNAAIAIEERGGRTDCTVDYLVQGVRRGHEGHAVVRERPHLPAGGAP